MDAAGELIGQMLRALGDALVGDAVERDLQAAFEREVQRVAQVRVVQVAGDSRPIPRAARHADADLPIDRAERAERRPPRAGGARGGVRSRLPAWRSAARRARGGRAGWRAGAGSVPRARVDHRALQRRRRAADRLEQHHAGAARTGRARRAHRFHGPHRRRERHRQGARRPADPRGQPAADTVRSSRSTARRWSKPCSRPSCSASKSARRRACAAAGASSSTPTAARCFSTKSRTCRSPRRPSCCAPSRMLAVERVGGHGVAPRQHAHRRGDEPVALRDGRARPVPSRPVLPARAASRSTCRRCARGARTSASSPRYFLSRHRQTRDLSLSDAAADALRMYDWPGNVRELERLIERAVALTESRPNSSSTTCRRSSAATTSRCSGPS